MTNAPAPAGDVTALRAFSDGDNGPMTLSQMARDLVARVRGELTLIDAAPVCAQCSGIGYVSVTRSLDYDTRRQEWTERESCPACHPELMNDDNAELPI